MRRIEIERRDLEGLRRQALEAHPRECCGFLLGAVATSSAARVAEILPASNVAAGQRRYRIAPGRVVAVQRQARARGLQVVGYYHSHPAGSAAPSEVDLREAWPESSYLILGVDGQGKVEARSWRLISEGSAFEEERLELLEGRHPQ